MFGTGNQEKPHGLFALVAALGCSIATLSGTIAMITLQSPFA